MSAAKARVSAGIEKAFYSLVDAAGAGQLAAGVDPGQNGQFLTDGHIGQGGQNQTDLAGQRGVGIACGDRKSTRLNSSHVAISYAVFCLEKETNDMLHV